ncbi:hypothetical protein MA16_Dca019704 [Dendrobium catenatum]|uniref:Uncharacterized protein n=1 Tax=Dendrobium catenatum TaxID=906689 RepID=A0A2I0WIH9_9ASPA|nr:hypothetical protein MA16_Dca019704 [Dendrobium catenatum]
MVPILMEPEDMKPEDIKQEDVQLEGVQPEDVQPEDVEPEYIKPEDIKLEDVKPLDAKPENVKPKDIKHLSAVAIQKEEAQAEAAKVDVYIDLKHLYDETKNVFADNDITQWLIRPVEDAPTQKNIPLNILLGITRYSSPYGTVFFSVPLGILLSTAQYSSQYRAYFTLRTWEYTIKLISTEITPFQLHLDEETDEEKKVGRRCDELELTVWISIGQRYGIVGFGWLPSGARLRPWLKLVNTGNGRGIRLLLFA